MRRILVRTVMTSVLVLPVACDRDDRPSTHRDRADRSGAPKFDDGPSLASQAPSVGSTAGAAAPIALPANAAESPAVIAPDAQPNTAPAEGQNTAPATRAARPTDDPISEMDQPRGTISEMDQPRGNTIGEMRDRDPRAPSLQGGDPIAREPSRDGSDPIAREPDHVR